MTNNIIKKTTIFGIFFSLFIQQPCLVMAKDIKTVSIKEKTDANSQYSHVLQYYKHRPDYNPGFIKKILRHQGQDTESLKIADIGSGNGTSREALVGAGIKPENVFEIDPNRGMRELSLANGGINVINGRASNTTLAANSLDMIAFFNNIHQVLKSDTEEDVKKEINRVLKPNGLLMFVAQRFDPHSTNIQDLHALCIEAKKMGLYPDYGKNGISFVLNESSAVGNVEVIVKTFAKRFLQKHSPEYIDVQEAWYNKQDFIGLMRSYLSFPTNPKPELIAKLENFFDEHANKDTNMVSIPCIQIAMVGKMKKI